MERRLAWKLTDASNGPYHGSLKEKIIPLDIESFGVLEAAGANIEIPSIFYDVSFYNSISITIYNHLLEAVKDCDTVLKNEGKSEFLNLAAIFFHEILRILCAFYFKQYEIDSLDVSSEMISGEKRRSKRLSSPYIDYDFVLHPQNAWYLDSSAKTTPNWSTVGTPERLRH